MDDVSDADARQRARFRLALNDLLSAVEGVRATEPTAAARLSDGMDLAVLETAWHDLAAWRDRYHAALAEARLLDGTERETGP